MHMDRVNAQRPGWLQALAVYGEPRMLAMLFLGFSSGLPFFPVLQTLTIWLRESGIALPAHRHVGVGHAFPTR